MVASCLLQTARISALMSLSLPVSGDMIKEMESMQEGCMYVCMFNGNMLY